jgi:hypothetical protein
MAVFFFVLMRNPCKQQSRTRLSEDQVFTDRGVVVVVVVVVVVACLLLLLLLVLVLLLLLVHATRVSTPPAVTGLEGLRLQEQGLSQQLHCCPPLALVWDQ